MVVLELCVKAELENVAKVIMPTTWHLELSQSDGDETRTVIVDPTNLEEISGSRGECNFKLKWPGSKKESHLNTIIPKSNSDQSINSDSAEKFVPVVEFECRGLEPTKWLYKECTFTVISETGARFEDVSLAEGDWYEYDEASGDSLGISNIEYQFKRK